MGEVSLPGMDLGECSKVLGFHNVFVVAFVTSGPIVVVGLSVYTKDVYQGVCIYAVNLCVYVCMYVCMCAHVICMHTYIHTLLKA